MFNGFHKQMMPNSTRIFFKNKLIFTLNFYAYILYVNFVVNTKFSINYLSVKSNFHFFEKLSQQNIHFHKYMSILCLQNIKFK